MKQEAGPIHFWIKENTATKYNDLAKMARMACEGFSSDQYIFVGLGLCVMVKVMVGAMMRERVGVRVRVTKLLGLVYG